MLDLPTDFAEAVRDRYRLERELGRGGMATVYLAEDLKHHRRVAMKVLRSDLAGVLGAERFQREIEMVGTLRHPHIMPLYDSGSAAGLHYQVMPLAEGESLRDRLLREGPLPLDDALRIAAEVADALEYAHERGVVHRDIKPENILLESGHAVVADFGIARAIDIAGGAQLTATGIAVGTPAYMSPEQIAGEKNIDGRSDLYSLGCVLYEMLSGQPPFTGANAATVVRQHMTTEPALVTTLRSAIPAEVASAVHRSLAKISGDRWRNAGELGARLHALRMTSSEFARTPVTPTAAKPVARRSVLIATGALVLLVVVSVALYSLYGIRELPEIAVGRRTQVTNAPGLEVHPALSPDGRLLAYTAGHDSRLMVRQVDGGSAIPVARDVAGMQGWPHWSPDGKQLAFSSARGIEIAPALGGAAQLLVSSAADAVGEGRLAITGPWSPDGGEISFVRGDTLFAAALSGGAPRQIFVAPRLHSCAWSADGRRIACVSGNFEAVTPGQLLGNRSGSVILSAPASGGKAVQLEDDGFVDTSPAWLPDGTLLFVSTRDGGRDIYATRVNADGRAAGKPRRVTTGLDALGISVSADGSRIAYAAFSESSNIWTIPIPTGEVRALATASPVTSGKQVIEWFDISRDGRWLVFDSDRSGNADLYRVALGSSAEPERITRDPGDEFYPMYSPDGRELVFHAVQNGRRQLFIVPAEGGLSRQVVSTDDDDRMGAWTPDGLALLTLSNYGSTDNETRIVRRGPGGEWSAPKRWRQPPCVASWSPDGTVAACAELGRRILLTNVKGDSLGTIATRGLFAYFGQFPQWSADGRTVYYVGEDASHTVIYGVPMRGGEPRVVFRFDDPDRPWHRFGFRVVADRFYFTLGNRESHVWVAELAR